jgi:hypothetical protein
VNKIDPFKRAFTFASASSLKRPQLAPVTFPLGVARLALCGRLHCRPGNMLFVLRTSAYKEAEPAPNSGRTPLLFHALLDLLSGFIGHFTRQVSYSPAAFQSGFNVLSHQVSLYSGKVHRTTSLDDHATKGGKATSEGDLQLDRRPSPR